jgi:hypothetical protein
MIYFHLPFNTTKHSPLILLFLVCLLHPTVHPFRTPGAPILTTLTTLRRVFAHHQTLALPDALLRPAPFALTTLRTSPPGFTSPPTCI